MSKLFSPRAVAGAFASLAFLGAAPAQAAPLVTFVSGKGADTGNCGSRPPLPPLPNRVGPNQPRRRDQGARSRGLWRPDHHQFDQHHREGAGIFRTAANSNAITINAGPNDTINLSRLTLDGFNTAQRGIVLHSGGSLTVTHCSVRNFGSIGIAVFPTGNTAFLIADTDVSDNSGASGIVVIPQGTGTAQGTLDHVLAHKNDNGIFVAGPSTVLAVDSTAADNRNLGFFGSPSAALRLARSAATGNGFGVFVQGKAEIASDNSIQGNETDVAGGTLDNVHTK